MNIDMISKAFLLMFGLAVAGAGCQEGAPPKAKTQPPSPPSVGREYGETLRGAMDKAHGAKDAFEASSRALEDVESTGK
jgi:hypothetical protein